MQLVIQDGYKDLTEADAQAIAAYLKTVPAVANSPEAPAMEEAMPQEEQSQPAQLPKTGGNTYVGLWLSGLLTLVGVVMLSIGWVLQRRRHRLAKF